MKTKEETIISILEDCENVLSPREILDLGATLDLFIYKSTTELVAEFHKAFNHPIREKPSKIPKEEFKFRLAVIREELDELEEAYEKDDTVGILDALIDAEYFIQGAVIQFGFKDVFEEGFNIVHRANMSKLCSPTTAIQTQDYYLREKLIHTRIEAVPNEDGKPSDKELVYVVQASGEKIGKILKPITWISPDLKPLIEDEV